MSRILIPVANSTSIQGYAFSRKRRLVAIRFSGRSDVCVYENVSLRDMVDLENAESKGSFVNERIARVYRSFDRLSEEEFELRYGSAFLSLRSQPADEPSG